MPTHSPALVSSRRLVFIGTTALIGSLTTSAFSPSVASAEQDPAITVAGDEETVTCSITPLSEDTALTAGHCGKEGDEVRGGKDADGERIGTIEKNYLTDGANKDAALVKLDPDHRIAVEDLPECISRPNVTDEITVDGGFTRGADGKIVSEQVGNGADAFMKSFPATYMLTDAEAEHGDSGAPIHSQDGCLAGLLTAGNGAYSALTLLPEEALESVPDLHQAD